MPGDETRTLSNLKPGKLKKYWGFFVWFNVIGVATESFAALGFFILLQRSIFPAGSHLSTEDIEAISSVTVPILLTFSALHYLVVRHIINNHVLRFLPRGFFKDGICGGCDRSSARQDCISLLSTLSYWQLALAALVIISYAFWGLIIWINYPDKVDLHLFLWIMGTGTLVALLYHLRLQIFDPTPLILGPRGSHGSALRSVRLVFADRDRKSVDDYRARLLTSRVLRVIQSLTARLLLALRIAERPQPPSQHRRAGEKTPGPTIDPEQLSGYQVQAVLHFLLLATLIVFTIRHFPEPDPDALLFGSRGLVSLYVGVSVFSAVVMDCYRLLFRLLPRDPDDVVHRLCAEAFGIITESTSNTEREAYLGRHDEKTSLLRHWCFERRLTEAIVGRHDHGAHGFAIIMVDIDNFKSVNSLFNYITGDFLLWCVAQCMVRSVREGDMVARYGGEELAVFLEDVTVDDAGIVAERIREDIAQSIRIEHEGGRLVAKLEVDGGVRRHVLGEVPAEAALGELREAVGRNPAGFAGVNRGPLEHLLDGGDAAGMVWSLTVSVGVVDSRCIEKPVLPVDGFTPGPTPDPRRRLVEYRHAYERMVEKAGECCLAAKRAGRDRTYVARGAGGPVGYRAER